MEVNIKEKQYSKEQIKSIILDSSKGNISDVAIGQEGRRDYP